MTRAVSIPSIAKTLLLGAIKAARDYERISEGYWLSHAPESFMQTMIAQKVASACKIPVTLESSPRKLAKDGHKCPDGRTVKTKLNSRFDIVGWSKSWRPRFIVEVKKMSSAPDGAIKDANRIRGWIGQSSSHMQAGFLVVYSEAKRPETLKRRFHSLTVSSSAKKYSAKLMAMHITQPTDDGWCWGVSVIRIM